MNTDIEKYINSGILEAYVMGTASPDEEHEVLYLKHKYPQVKDALSQLENDLENMAKTMAIPPPPGAWGKIEAQIDDLIVREKGATDRFTQKERPNYARPDNEPDYIEVEAESNYIKVNKIWKWVFAAVFILSKVFLICAIYFYLENRQAQKQLQELKLEIQVLKK